MSGRSEAARGLHPQPHPIQICTETNMKALKIAAAATLLMTGGSAVAQSASDAQCLILSNAFASQAKDENGKKVAEGAFYFYLGRVGANATSAQLKTLLDAQMKSITDATAGKLMTDCANRVREKMQLVQSIAGSAQPTAPAPKQAQPQGR
jgi:hypothetical protein